MTSKVRRCAFCGDRLPSDAHPSRKFCDADCRAGRAKKRPALELGAVGQATEEAIADAEQAGAIGTRDAGAVAALRVLAMKIDTEAELREAAVAALREGLIVKPPPIDNVTLPTYLKFCEALGLTPGKRPVETKPTGGAGGGKLHALSEGVRKPRTA